MQLSVFRVNITWGLLTTELGIHLLQLVSENGIMLWINKRVLQNIRMQTVIRQATRTGSNTKKILDDSETSIIKKLVPDIEEVAIDNRKYFNLISKYIRWFISNKLPMRAHRVDEIQLIKVIGYLSSNFN